MAPAAAAWSRRRPRAGRRPGARLRSRSGRTGEPARGGPHRRLPGCREPTRAHGGGRLLPPAARPGLCRRHDPEHAHRRGARRPGDTRSRTIRRVLEILGEASHVRRRGDEDWTHCQELITWGGCWVLAALPDGRRDRFLASGLFRLCAGACHLVPAGAAVSGNPRTHSGRDPGRRDGRCTRRLSTDGHGRR
jgi:hypothetical protein